MKKKFLAIGAGRFGKSVVKELHTQRNHVVACDMDESLLAELDEYTNHTVIGNATETSVLEDINVTEFDSVVVSIGDNFEACIFIVRKLKKLGCPHVIAKANDHFRGEILSEVGADKVIYPEEETGIRLARQLSNPGLLEYVQLAPHCSGIEMKVPRDFIGKNLAQLDFRRKYKSTVVMIAKLDSEYPIISPMPDVVFEEGDIFFIVGDNEDLEKLKRKAK